MRKSLTRLIIIYSCLMLSGCGMNTGAKQQTSAEISAVSSNSYSQLADSLDTAVIEKVDASTQTIKFWNLESGRSYTLNFDNATGIKDRHDQELVAEQLQSGDIVQVTFQKDTKRAVNIWLDKTVTITEMVTSFTINKTARTLEMNGGRFALDNQAVVLSQGKQLELMDINSADTLTVYSIDHEVYSLVIANGHGYARLVNAEAFEGGWVEFGQSIIKKVEPDMLLIIPEGSYEMLISHGRNSGTKQVEIKANEETQIDVADLVTVDPNQTGGIIFTITPNTAELKIDGEKTDYSQVVNLPYGIHQMSLRAEGYKSITQYIKVGQEMANISIDMEKGDSSDSISSNGTVSANSAVAASDTGDYSVYVDAPRGAELYVNGKYIGIVPTTFTKKKGSYTVSLRKSGYTTRSYSLEIDESKKDIHYSFSELEAVRSLQ